MPNYHWNSYQYNQAAIVIVSCYKHHQSAFSLLSTRYGAMAYHSPLSQKNSHYYPCAINVFLVKSISCLRGGRETMHCLHVMTPDPAENRKSISITNVTNLTFKISNRQQILREKYQCLEINYSLPGKTTYSNVKPIQTPTPRNPSKFKYRKLNYIGSNFSISPAINTQPSRPNGHQLNETETIYSIPAQYQAV